MLSNFERGFAQYIEVVNGGEINKRKAHITRKVNEAVCMMASEDLELMKKIVVNNWVIERALNSATASKYL